MAALRRAVGVRQIEKFQEAALAALPIGDRALRLPIAHPEEAAGIRLRAGRDVFEGLHNVRGERRVDRCSALSLIEQNAIAI